MKQDLFNQHHRNFRKLSVLGMAFVVLMMVFTMSAIGAGAYETHMALAAEEVDDRVCKPGPDNTLIIPKLELPPEEVEAPPAVEEEPAKEEVKVEEPKKEEVHEVKVASRSAGVRVSNGTTRSALDYSENEIKALIKQVAAEIGLDWRVLDALVHVESTYNPSATSSTGRHHGLCQVSRQNYDNLTSTLGLVPSGGSNYFDPYSNLKCGAYILQCSLIETQNYHKALVYYNMGKGAATKRGITKSAYSKKVMRYAAELGFTP